MGPSPDVGPDLDAESWPDADPGPVRDSGPGSVDTFRTTNATGRSRSRLVIAVATAVQESDLRNLPGGDRDSIGLFQQRPSQGWAAPLLINPAPDLAGHVVIFDHWTDTTMTSYVGFEQSGDSGTHHRVIPYPYFGDYVMSAYRWSE